MYEKDMRVDLGVISLKGEESHVLHKNVTMGKLTTAYRNSWGYKAETEIQRRLITISRVKIL